MNDSLRYRKLLSAEFEAKAKQRYIERLPGTVRFWMDPRLADRLEVDEVTHEIAEALMQDNGPRGPHESVVTSLRSRTMDALDRIHQEYLGRDDVYHRQPVLRLSGLPPANLKDLATGLIGADVSQSDGDSATMWLGLQRAFNSLSLHHREILAMRHFERLTLQEIAETTQLSAREVSSRYRRSLVRLREKLALAFGHNRIA